MLAQWLNAVTFLVNTETSPHIQSLMLTNVVNIRAASGVNSRNSSPEVRSSEKSDCRRLNLCDFRCRDSAYFHPAAPPATTTPAAGMPQRIQRETG